jgi:hypothetical protein
LPGSGHTRRRSTKADHEAARAWLPCLPGSLARGVHGSQRGGLIHVEPETLIRSHPTNRPNRRKCRWSINIPATTSGSFRRDCMDLQEPRNRYRSSWQAHFSYAGAGRGSDCRGDVSAPIPGHRRGRCDAGRRTPLAGEGTTAGRDGWSSAFEVCERITVVVCVRGGSLSTWRNWETPGSERVEGVRSRRAGCHRTGWGAR